MDEEPGGLQSMGSLRVGYDWASSLSLFPFMHWRRKWQPTSVFLLGESQGWWSLVGCSPWGCEELDMTERLHFHFSLSCIGEGSGNPLRCSCLENPRDRGASWATIYGVAQSWTLLKQLSSSSSFFSCTYFGEGNGNPLQYSCLENHMERGAWRVTVPRVVKSQTQLSNWATTMCTYLPFLYLIWRNNYC